MSINNYKTFVEETQVHFEISFSKYKTKYYAEAGMDFELTMVRTIQVCPKCQCTDTIVHDHTNKVLHGGTFNGVPVRFHMKHCRYLCKQCDSTFMQPFENLAPYKAISNETENYIIPMFGTMPFTEIADSVGVSTQTIVNRAEKYMETERHAMLHTPYKYLSMDEIFISRDSDGQAQYYWVLNDISVSWKSNNIRIESGRNKGDIVNRLLELQYPERVLAVVIDMWAPYRDAITEALPHTAIVIDPFHVIKTAERAMDSVRKQVTRSSLIKSALKKDARLFLSSMYKLTVEELRRVEFYLRADATLEKAYFIVQELLGFCWIKDYECALAYIAAWEDDVHSSGIEELISVLHTIQNWLPYIMNYFIHRITNGKTEGKNHLLRTIDSLGFHYGLKSVQACVYAHDRKQEYVRWMAYQSRKEKARTTTPFAKTA